MPLAKAFRAASIVLIVSLLLHHGPFHPDTTRANGVPIRIPLTYLAGLSNYGPQDAHGDAELSFAEAVVKLDVRGLPPLTDEIYQVWLVKSGTNKALAVGTFNTDGSGNGGFTGKITNLDGYDYDLLSLTAEPQPDSDPAPSAKRSIGGFFTPLNKPNVAADAAISADTAPATLPNTGDALPEKPPANRRHAIAAVLFALGGASAYIAMRRGRRSTP